MMLTGGCLCGAVRYAVTGDIITAGHCHCSICRRAHGAAFATWMIIDPGGFRWLEGEEKVKRYVSSPDRARGFCVECGAPLVAFHNGEVGEVVMASIDGDPGVRPEEHIFVGSKAPWHEITDDLRQHAEWPPGMGP